MACIRNHLKINYLTLRRLLGAVVFVSSCLLVGGCWDRVEIQDRGFVLAVGIDTPDIETDKAPGAAKMRRLSEPGKEDRFLVSLQVMKFGGVKSGEEKAGGESKTYLITNRGPGTFEAVRNALSESSKGLWFENLQAVIISEEVVRRHGLSKVIDLLRRDAEMRWRAQVFITPGEAKKLLDSQPPSGEPGGIYLGNVARRSSKDPHLPMARTDISFASQTLDTGGDIIFPVLEAVEKNVRVKGGALFKKDQFIGYVDEYFIKGLRFILATEKSAAITYECPIHPGNLVTFELFRHQTKFSPKIEGDKISFILDIALRGNLAEIQCEKEHDTMDVEYLRKAQELIAEEIKRNIEHTFTVSKSLGWEMMYMRKSLQAYEPETWEKVKDKWDEIYPTIPIKVIVRVAIINVGEHK